MEDKLITVSTMLFILSMISERVVTFFKLWCVSDRSFWGIVPKEIDTSIKSDNPLEENKRQKAILSINLSISFLIALSVRQVYLAEQLAMRSSPKKGGTDSNIIYTLFKNLGIKKELSVADINRIGKTKLTEAEIQELITP